jgi:hypothetical protein
MGRTVRFCEGAGSQLLRVPEDAAGVWAGAGRHRLWRGFRKTRSMVTRQLDPQARLKVPQAEYATWLRLTLTELIRKAGLYTPGLMPKTPDFDAYLMVDWSANNRPKTGRDSIWYCLLERVKGRPRRTVANPPTRQQAVAQLITHLLDLTERGQSTLLGFDCAYGYPRGFALGLDTTAPWRAVWDWLTANMQDDERNQNNRFEVAAEINSAISGRASRFGAVRVQQSGPA